MDSPGKYPSQLSFLPLRDAVLCIDCNFVSADEQGMCPVCFGHSLVRIAGLLQYQTSTLTGWRKVLHHLGFRRRLRPRDLSYAHRPH